MLLFLPHDTLAANTANNTAIFTKCLVFVTPPPFSQFDELRPARLHALSRGRNGFFINRQRAANNPLLSPVYMGVLAEVIALTAVEAESEGSAARLGRLFENHHHRLYRLARRLSSSPDDARDAVQDAFVRAAQNLDRVPNGSSSEEAWLVRVLVNICRDKWRHRAVRSRADARTSAFPTTVNSDESRVIAHDAVWRALEALPVRRRAVIVMYELEGIPIPAIAQSLGLTAVTVRWHLSRGRRELAQIIGRTS